jgi:glycosyltransferase involved in cell wall biosynthesis
MLSFHFPPISSSSGFLRSLKFAKYLSRKQVDVTVLTTTQGAYESVDEKNHQLLDSLNINVYRALGLDASRHLSIKGKYFGFMTWPDKWSSWSIFALFKGLWLNFSKKFDLLWVTFPIPSALLAGYLLKKLTHLPMVLDLRDPVWEEETWTDTTRNRILKWLELKCITAAYKVVFTSPGTVEKYTVRYPELMAEKAVLLTNGYDEEDFTGIDANCQKHGKRVFLHSGLIPPYERNPEHFFVALSVLKKRGILDPQRHEFRLRASGHSHLYIARVEQLDIQDLVTFPGPISYHEALAELMGADALMIFQDASCNWQIPAKVFEYLRVKRPILAWTDLHSDTAIVLREQNPETPIAPLSSATEIDRQLALFIERDEWSDLATDISRFSRESLTDDLHQIFKSSIKKGVANADA